LCWVTEHGPFGKFWFDGWGKGFLKEGLKKSFNILCLLGRVSGHEATRKDKGQE